MCKHPVWRRIAALHKRLIIWPKRIAVRKKMPVEKICALLQMANIDSMDDIQNLLNGTIAEFMENGLES